MAVASLRIQIVRYENPLETLLRTVASINASLELARQAGVLDDAEIIVGDCSPARLPGWERLNDVAEAVGGVGYRHFAENLGSGGGSNRLAADAQTDLLLVLNPDTYVVPSLVSTMVTFFNADPAIGIADARQLPLEHPKAYDRDTRETSWASGACMMIRGTAFLEVGGFDAEFFPLYCDDVDLSWQIRRAGWRCIHVASAAVFHDKRISLDGIPVASDREIHSGTLARLFLTLKWGRNDLHLESIAACEASNDVRVSEALDEFREYEKAGNLPTEVPDAAQVAEFVSGNYANHRF